MATSIHAAKTYKVEYGTGVNSDLYQSAINGILDEISEEFYTLDGMDSPQYSNHSEITVAGMERVIKEVKEMTEEEFQTLYESHQEYDEMKMTKEEFLHSMQRLYDEADKSDGFIHLMWF